MPAEPSSSSRSCGARTAARQGQFDASPDCRCQAEPGGNGPGSWADRLTVRRSHKPSLCRSFRRAVHDFGPDGVPISHNGQTVYRATSLPTSTSFFFGGRVGRDAGCAPPTTLLAKPPACGYWTIDGVGVGTMVPIPESVIGSPIVALIDRSHALGICTRGPCRTTDLLVVSKVLWYGPPAPLVPFASQRSGLRRSLAGGPASVRSLRSRK